MRRIEMIVTGGCQCGAVRYRTDVMLDNAHICHCRMCQKAMGNIFAALVATPNANLVWTRGGPSVFRSSAHAERGFCKDCGTPLFYDSLDNDRINLTIGSLDDPGLFPPLGEVGVEGRVRWYPELLALKVGEETGAGDARDWAVSVKASSRQHPDHDTQAWPQPAQDN
jgi:hypothetical protein